MELNRATLVAELMQKTSFSRKDADLVVRALFDGKTGIVATALRRGGSVSLSGFGRFSVRERAARTARNPKTGESVKVSKRKVPAFKAGALLKTSIGGNKK